MKNMLNNSFMNIMTKVYDLCWLNILAFICCIPVVTSGAALTALYAVMLKMAKDEEGTVTASYIKEFKENLKGSIGGWLVLLVILVLLAVDLNFWTNSDSENRSLFWAMTLVCLGALMAVASWYFAVRAKFIEGSIDGLKRALKFAFCFLPATIVMGAVTLAVFWFMTKHFELIVLLPIGLITILEYPKAVYIRKKYDKLFA